MKRKVMTQKEFEDKVESIRPKLRKTAFRFFKATGIEEEEDTTQEVLLKLWLLISSGYEVRDLEALAVRMTKNMCVSKFRKRGNFPARLSAEENLESGLSASKRLEEREARVLSEKLLGRLNPTQRTYIKMRHDGGMSLDEISFLTGKPKTSVKSTISAARRRLLDLLKKDNL